jgi:hypothetical protein
MGMPVIDVSQGPIRQKKPSLTHLAIVVLSPTARTDKCVEPRLHTTADDGVETLIRCLVATEKIEEMKLRREGRDGVECWGAFNES